MTDIDVVQQQQDLIDRIAAELERLGKGVERIAAKHGADHPEVAEALHLLLRDRALNGDCDERYDETYAQMRDPDRYAELRALTFADRHACPVRDCRLSAEEHHRLAFGIISENHALRRRVSELENGLAALPDQA